MEAGTTRKARTGRDADWWLRELGSAREGIVTAESIAQKEPRLEWILKQREKHLAQAEERVERILAGIGEVSEPWVAEAARQHFVYGRTWPETAEAVGYSRAWVIAKYDEAVKALSERAD